MNRTICENIMWVAMKKSIFRFVAGECPDMDFKAFQTRFRKRYWDMCAEVDDIGTMHKNPLRVSLTGGIVWLAAYEACDGKMDEAMFSRMVVHTMHAPLFQKAFALQKPFDRKTQRKKAALAKAANELSDSEFNWQTEYRLGRAETEYFCTYYRCGLCALGRKYGHQKLIPYMCQMDYISIDRMGGTLYRTQTLATGGSCCDFHVVKQGTEGEKEN